MNKFQTILFFLYSSILSTQLFAQIPSHNSNEIIIEGKSKERKEINRPGQSLIIRPHEETRYDLQTQLKSDPSVANSYQGKSSGFSLPLFRGQDARSTHVFIDDVELQDPYSGLPMVDEIDLRSFGSVTIHKGFAPWDLSVMEPGGVIQFNKRPSVHLGSQQEGGLGYGDVAGSSGWGRGSYNTDILESSLYGRRSTSNGRYSVYNDNGTVLNPQDDSTTHRKNNDRTSQQGLGHLNINSKSWSSNTLAWIQQSSQGIPTINTSDVSRARVQSSTKMANSSIKYLVTDNMLVGANIGYFDAQRIFSDPTSSIGFATNRKLESQSLRLKSFLRNDSNFISWLATLEQAQAKSRLNSSYADDLFAPAAKAEKAFLGSKISLPENQIIELKLSAERSTSESKTQSGTTINPGQTSPSSNQSFAWSGQFSPILVYAQLGQSTRFPSLLERLGNGADIDGSSDLKPEQSVAAESGIKHRSALFSKSIQLGLTIWGRNNKEVIRIEKISANRWRAKNSQDQSYRGIELRSELSGRDASIELALSGTQAHEGAQQLLVPRVPIWQAAGSLSYKIIDTLTMRTGSRFTGRMYDDHSNTRELDWSLVHDLSLDYVGTINSFKAGISINNVTNYTSTKVTDTVTHQADGRMAYAGYSGEPLTGRSFIASVSASL